VKRTRRIEVVRYTRRVTVSEGGNAPADADELCAIANTPGTPEEERAAAFEPAEHKTPRRATPFRLRDLLRLRR